MEQFARPWWTSLPSLEGIAQLCPTIDEGYVSHAISMLLLGIGWFLSRTPAKFIGLGPLLGHIGGHVQIESIGILG
jgi:hypothetical protein